jgi:hypothetical protein
MQAVLYTHALEPITVVDIPIWLWDRLLAGEVIRLAVQEPPKLVPSFESVVNTKLRIVNIFGERIRRREHEALMLFTSDEESALILKADFLPGQRGELQSRERRAFAKGFIKALYDFR